ncbi:hypothetical protein FSARC_8552 [Fusarium sarcochroum]|uniref:Uncharacterized protein n=1 Tax=Fusarium sarcochroum TaxID=1208366 RepID=A0A8H4X6V6_9HYPO|nr:hypothetical protein FSARC_8552 [Fusarium sarcochroum]
MAAARNYAWRQVSPGVWQRHIDEIEQFYSTMVVLYEGSGRMFFGMTGHLSLSVENSKGRSPENAELEVDKALEKAWLALRYAHPTLASEVTQNAETNEWTKTYREIQREEDRSAWLEKTLVHISNGQTGNEWANSDPPAPKVPTMFVLDLPSERGDAESSTVRRDLVFRSPHDVIDGIGTLIMLNNFVTLAAEAYKKGDSYGPPALDGSEASNLSPSYRVAASIPDELAQDQLDRLEQMAAQKAAVASDPSVEALALPFRKGAIAPGRHQRLALTLTQQETRQLLTACKAVGATPTHTFHAAAAMIVRDLQERPSETKRVRYINYILRNERSSCVEPYNTTQHPAAVYHSVSGQSLVVDMDLHPSGTELDPQTRRNEFLSILETIKDFYLTVKQDKEFYIIAPVMFSQATPTLPASPKPLPVPPPKAYPSVSISSMGRTDAIVAPETGAFSARDPWVTGEELGNGLGLFLGTSQGELCLSAAYNDAWHTEDDVKQYLERCKDAVFFGVGIKSS